MAKRLCCVAACWFSAAAAAWGQATTPTPDKPAKPTPALLQGKVVDQATGKSLKKTVLSLRPASGLSGKSMSAESDDEGNFSIPNIPPGLYALRGERAGYAQQAYNARSGASAGAQIPVREGEEIKGLVFKLIPNSIISGKVVDEDGDPVRAMVQVLRWGYLPYGKVLQPAGVGPTGATGEYSISVPPGDYLLMTTPQNTLMLATTDKPATDAPELRYAAEFYPGSPDQLGATTVHASAGVEMRAMDFHLTRVKTFRVRGKVPEGTKVAMVQLMPKAAGPASSSSARAAQVQPDKTFEFVGVLPGSYNLAANGEGGMTYSNQAVIVQDRHVGGLSPTFLPVGDIKGTVTIEGDATAKRAGVLIGFDAYENGSNPYGATQDDGKYMVRMIRPGQYHAWVANWPPNCYPKSITYDGRDIKDTALDISEGITGPVDVVLSPTAGQVTGVVIDGDGKAVPGALVVLVPNSGNYLMHYHMNTDYEGKFKMPPVRPGEYKILAWDEIPYYSWFDKEFLKPYMSKATEVSVAENDKKVLSLKMIQAEAK